MKRVITTILVAISISIACYAQNGSDQDVDFKIDVQDEISTPIYRSPAVVPVHGFYVSSVNTVYLSFDFPIGDVTYYVQNIEIGYMNSGIIPSDSGTQTLPLPESSGAYRITLATSTGQRFIARVEF